MAPQPSPGVDPDIADITPGPQPLADWQLELVEEETAETAETATSSRGPAMRARPAFAIGITAAALAASLAGLEAQRPDAFLESRDHPAILYSFAPPDNRIEALNRRLADGSLRFDFDPVSGYLTATLAALALPVESQVLVFSETSFQRR